MSSEPSLHALSNTVSISRTVTGEDGNSHFADVEIPLTQDSKSPFLMSRFISATAISFRWTPGDYTSQMHCAPRHRLLLVLSGCIEVEVHSGEVRRFECGDILEVSDTHGTGHISRSGSAAPVRTAIINLDRELVTPRDKPWDPDLEGGEKSIGIYRTFANNDGVSNTVKEELPLVKKGPSGRLTPEEPLLGFQYVVAPPSLDYAWHQAPQLQYVLPLTGGMEVENGHGTRHAIAPGDIYRGEDTTGRGHITRAIAGRERLCVFAHLAG